MLLPVSCSLSRRLGLIPQIFLRDAKRDNMTNKYLRRVSVEEVTGLSRSAIYALMAKGEFPRPVRLTTRAVAWSESAVVEWLHSRPSTTR